MTPLLVLLLGQLARAATPLADIALAVCACPRCTISPLRLELPVPVAVYGNASADTMDWIGAARDFLPDAPVQLDAPLGVDCADCFSLLLNGTDVAGMLPWRQLSPTRCEVAYLFAGPGDYSFVAGLRLPLAQNASFAKPPAGRPNALVQNYSFDRGSLDLVLQPDLADCELPQSFAFCGGVFVRSCLQGFTGTCADANYTAPAGCRGDPLFAPPALPPAASSAGTVAAIVGSVVAAVGAAGGSVASAAVSEGAAMAAAAPVRAFVPLAKGVYRKYRRGI
jgi:hypothetical protein